MKASTPDWGDVRRLRPVFPLWLEMDLTYGLADYQAWRTDMTYWTQENAPRFRPAPHPIPYIGLGSGAEEEIAPPTNFPSVTMRVLPLPADGNKLDLLLQKYLDNPFFTFTHTGGVKGDAVVNLILSNFQNMVTMAPQGGPYKDYELTFAIPATWTNKSNGSSGICLDSRLYAGGQLLERDYQFRGLWAPFTEVAIYKSTVPGLHAASIRPVGKPVTYS